MMGDELLNQRDEVMRGIAVERMKHKNLNEFKRQTYEKLLVERAQRKEQELRALEEKKRKEKEEQRLKNHRDAVAREKRIIFVCNPNNNHRWTSIHSEAYQRKYNKKYEYY